MTFATVRRPIKGNVGVAGRSFRLTALFALPGDPARACFRQGLVGAMCTANGVGAACGRASDACHHSRHRLTMPNCQSAQPHVGKRAGPIRWDRIFAGAPFDKVARRVGLRHVAPALKRAARNGFRQNHRPVQHNGAAQDAVFTPCLFQPQNGLATQDKPFDHPIQAAPGQFILPFWPHACDMDSAACGPAMTLAVLPGCHILNRFCPDTQLLQMQHFAPESPATRIGRRAASAT
jgi:hypothetical protein